MTDHKLQMSDCDPLTGLQLKLALGFYGDQFIAQEYPSSDMVALLERSVAHSARRNLPPTDTSYIDPKRLVDLRSRADARTALLLADIAAQLRCGKLYAVGIRAGQYDPIKIPREWWTVATLDPETNSAEGNGVTFSGLLIFETAQPPAPRYSRPTPEDWMSQNVTQPRQWKRDDAILECRKATGGTHLKCRDAWDALDADLKGTRGQHKD